MTGTLGLQGAALESGGAAALATKGLRFAAMPTFALMALASGLGASPIDQLCATAHGGPLGGMTGMYLLMSAFHAPPWLGLVFRPRA